MSEDYEIIIFCIDYAMRNAFQPCTQERIEQTKEWLDSLAAIDYEINSKADARTEND